MCLWKISGRTISQHFCGSSTVENLRVHGDESGKVKVVSAFNQLSITP
jgi:hypothetical protein